MAHVPWTKLFRPVENVLVDGLEIRDTTSHTPDTDPTKMFIIDCRDFEVITIFVDNNLDQDISVQVMGNRRKSTTKAVTVGTAFTVAADSSDSRTLTPDTSGWLPYIYVTITATVAPTADAVTVYIIKKP